MVSGIDQELAAARLGAHVDFEGQDLMQEQFLLNSPFFCASLSLVLSFSAAIRRQLHKCDGLGVWNAAHSNLSSTIGFGKTVIPFPTSAKSIQDHISRQRMN